MKKLIIPALIVLVTLSLPTGCTWSIGSGPKNSTIMPTVGQQLVDLQKAKDVGAISEAEYQAQKARILGGK
jgi:hypothetical protein